MMRNLVYTLHKIDITGIPYVLPILVYRQNRLDNGKQPEDALNKTKTKNNKNKYSASNLARQQWI